MPLLPRLATVFALLALATSAPVALGQADEGAARAALQAAEQSEASGNANAALSAYRSVVRDHPGTAAAGTAQLKIGQLYEAHGNTEAAFRAYETYVTKFPNGADFSAVVDSQFRIANQFLEGERKRLFGVRTFPSMVRAQEMFESILKNAPFSAVAPRAQFNVGQALEKQGKPAEALVAYEAVVARYPTDPAAGDAMYQIGFVYLDQYRKGAYDPNVAQRARDAFEDFLARFPNNEKAAQARDNIALLSGSQTKDALGVAKFYDRTKNYKAAVIYYNEVIRQQPTSPDADEAKKRIDELVAEVGEDAIRPGPERAETGERARARRRFQAQVDTAARPDYAGPPVAVVPDETAPARPRLRTTSPAATPARNIPAVEPSLPTP